MILALSIVLVIYRKNSKYRLKPLDAEVTKARIKPIDFVNTLDELGYFQFTKPDDLKDLKQLHLENFDPSSRLPGDWDDKSDLPLDYRFYLCDSESLFEAGGFEAQLTQIQATFKKIGLKIEIQEYKEHWDEDHDHLNQSIKINNKEYEIFKNFKGKGWSESLLKLAEILNSELSHQNIKEKVYLIGYGNDSCLIFLDHSLFTYLNEVFIDPWQKPLSIEQWTKLGRL